MELNGSGDYVKVVNAPSLNPQKEFSICAWYYPVPFAGNGVNSIIGKALSDDSYYQFNLAVTGSEYRGSTGGTDWRKFSFYMKTTEGPQPILWSGTLPNTNFYKYEFDRWYFVVITYDGSQCKMYLNSELDGQQAVFGDLITNVNTDIYMPSGAS